MSTRRKVRLGDLLLENGIISAEQLHSARQVQTSSGMKLGRVLVDSGCISEPRLLEFVSKQLDIPFVDLRQHQFDSAVVREIPEMLARRYRVVALRKEGDAFLVGMADPTDIFAYDELARVLKRPFELAVVSESVLLQSFDAVYRRTEEIEELAEELNEELSGRDLDLGQLAGADDVADAPVVKLIQSLFQDTAQIEASDLHIEPDEGVLRIRQRVDGVLQEQVMDEARIAPALVLRLKLMAGLDIAEKRLPQDGRFSLKVNDKTYDVRISTMPVLHGESVVMRLLDQSAGLREMRDLGMAPSVLTSFEHAISRPHGMVLVTGPTGSGKTTTLYSALKTLNRPETKIITVEDPVEYRLPRVNQVQVHSRIGLDFARVLRAVLRQDPDVLLVGEMRDEETVEIGLRAAMTGHLVLSTLHTNDSISSVSRLLDMGAPGYLVASALVGVVAQRLMRRICSDCSVAQQPTPPQHDWLKRFPGAQRHIAGLRVGSGCSRCNFTGYRGRVGAYEYLSVNPQMQSLLSQGDTAGFEQAAVAQLGRHSLLACALRNALTGVTTLDEVLRLFGEARFEFIAENDANSHNAYASEQADQEFLAGVA